MARRAACPRNVADMRPKFPLTCRATRVEKAALHTVGATQGAAVNAATTPVLGDAAGVSHV